MDVDEFVRQHFQLLQTHHTVVHERTTLAAAVQLAANDTFVKLGLDDTFVFPIGDRLAVRTRTEHERQGTQDDTLAGTRLTRHDGESLREINVQMTDQRVVLYV